MMNVNETQKRKPLVMRARVHPVYKKYFDMIIHDGKLPNEVYGLMDPSLDKSLIRTPNRLVRSVRARSARIFHFLSSTYSEYSLVSLTQLMTLTRTIPHSQEYHSNVFTFF